MWDIWALITNCVTDHKTVFLGMCAYAFLGIYTTTRNLVNMVNMFCNRYQVDDNNPTVYP